VTEISIAAAHTDYSLDAIRVLLREYAEYLKSSIGAAQMCFTAYAQELAALPAPYTKLLLASSGSKPAGCVLLKPIQAIDSLHPDEIACEMKRLWVRPEFRQLGIGRMLTEQLIFEARREGFTAMYLDTVPAVMQNANRIYRNMGFEPVPRYNHNLVANVEFFRLPLISIS
jgi:putative acetyltransferase